MDTTHDHGSMTSTTIHDHGSMTSTTLHDHGSMTNAPGAPAECCMNHIMMMQMWFEAGYKAVVLFEGWDITTEGAMVGSCFGVFLMALIYEGLKYFREKLHRQKYVSIEYNKVKSPDGSEASSETSKIRKAASFKSSITSASHYIQTILHLVQLVLAYFLMLIVMTYNVWLFISVILGCTCGYFLFGWQRGIFVDITEHCH